MESLFLSSAHSHPLRSNVSWSGAIFNNKRGACSSREIISRGQANFKNKLNSCSSFSSKLDIHKHSPLERPTSIHRWRNITQRANSASHTYYETDPDSSSPINTNNSLKDGFITLVHFIRPFPFIGTILSVISASFLSVEWLADLNPMFFGGLLQAIVAASLMNVFVAGINQFTDIEIDKINKPYLPLPSGKISPATAIMIIAFSLIMATSLGIMVGSKPLLWAILCSFVYGTGYSVNLPLLRWKNSATTAAISISVFQSLVVPIAYFLHMQTHVLRRATYFPRSLVFTIAFKSIFTIVLALLKDIPDIEGDKKHGVKSLTAYLGQKQVFRICISILLAEYAGAILVGLFSSNIFNKVIMVIGHAILALALWARAKTIDLESKDVLESFYVFIWQLFNAEYLLIPFVK